MTKPKLYGFYRPHRRVQATGELVNHKTGEVYTPPSMTKQSFLKECDINNILKEYRVTGQIRHMSANAAAGAYQDLPEPMDFQESIHTMQAADAAFSSLPSAVRKRFGNDPGEFLAFMADPANQDELIKMGLAKDTRPPAPPAPPEAPPAPGGAGGTPPAPSAS